MTKQRSRLLLSALVAFTLWTGWRALDFGYHWDEQRVMIKPIALAVQSKSLLPRVYAYPSLLYDVGLVSLLPDVVAGSFSSAALLETIASKSFLLRMRAFTVLASSAALVVVFLLFRLWTANEKAALFAAALLASSWEVGYHARWFTVDPWTVPLGILTLLCLERARGSSGRQWLRAAAASAAVAAGTKYTAGLLIVPVLLFSLWPGNGVPRRRAIEAVGVFIAVFLLITPGVLFETPVVWTYLTLQAQTYASGHSAYTVNAGVSHFWLVLRYLAEAALSPHRSIALLLFAFSLVGLVDYVRTDRKAAMIFLSFPLLYLLFMSFYRVMIVRNHLILIPFLALLAARGIFAVHQRAHTAAVRRPFWALLVVAVAMNLMFLHQAATSIVTRQDRDQRHDLWRFIERNRDKNFVLSPRLGKEWAKIVLPAHVKSGPKESGDYVALYNNEISLGNSAAWTPVANRYNAALTSFGPRDVNFNFYPTWQGDERIVVVRIADLRGGMETVRLTSEREEKRSDDTAGTERVRHQWR